MKCNLTRVRSHTLECSAWLSDPDGTQETHNRPSTKAVLRKRGEVGKGEELEGVTARELKGFRMGSVE